MKPILNHPVNYVDWRNGYTFVAVLTSNWEGVIEWEKRCLTLIKYFFI